MAESKMSSLDTSSRLLSELEAMGFPLDQVMKALQHSGNSNISAAVSWLLDHGIDPIANETPMNNQDFIDIDIDASEPSYGSEQVMLKTKEIREQAHTKKEEHENKWEVEKEKERIRAGKELLEAKQIQEDNERKRFILKRKAEKGEQNKERIKIRKKLQQDELERRGQGLPLEDLSLLTIIESSVQEIKDPLPIAAVKISGTAKDAEQMRNSLISLKRIHKDDTRARTAFWTLLTYVRNVVNNPDEARFRKIRIGNPVFQARIGNAVTLGIEFLELCGFERTKDDKFLFLDDQKVDMKKLSMGEAVLNSAITNPFFGLVSR
ncbi:uncharacterized protein LOC124916800 [Impatiens glandulifera]|uniref:uncharacterized protein LOC124916800 n=1 Tax=Impatiens glandulifera TaxID=253017 RepID=UPI001FB15775|nr:uncharacterized protein LOC124916800 [Impatiens glandulifera]